MMLVVDPTHIYKCGNTTFIVQPRLQRWFETAPHNAHVIYATGDVAMDRRVGADPSGLLNASANYMHKLARQGYVELTQRKLYDNYYEYRVRKK